MQINLLMQPLVFVRCFLGIVVFRGRWMVRDVGGGRRYEETIGGCAFSRIASVVSWSYAQAFVTSVCEVMDSALRTFPRPCVVCVNIITLCGC